MTQSLVFIYLLVASAIFLVGAYRIMENSKRYGDPETLAFVVLAVLMILWPGFLLSQALRWLLDLDYLRSVNAKDETAHPLR